MSKQSNSLTLILDRLEAFAPLNLASSWDNVGLLVDCDANIETVMLTNDLTEDVVQEAIASKAGLIISYHSNIFQGWKSVKKNNSWKDRVIIECIRHNIAIFSPHTVWDTVKNGVTDWLSKAFAIKSSNPIIPVVNSADMGAGRFCLLEEPITISEAIALIKKHVGVANLQLGLAKKSDENCTIQNVAVCAGSGYSVISTVQADLYLTGEMQHYQILDAIQKNISVILCNHSDSERGFLKEFRKELEVDVLKGEFNVLVSNVDKDPIKII